MSPNRRATDPLLIDIHAMVKGIDRRVGKLQETSARQEEKLSTIESRGCQVAAAVAGDVQAVCATIKNLEADVKQMKIRNRIIGTIAAGAAGFGAWFASFKGSK